MQKTQSGNLIKTIALWSALIIVALLAGKYATSSWRKYQAWETHRSFFELPAEEQTVKSWMSPNFIQRHYGIDMDLVLGFSLGFWETRKPLVDLCNSHSINCNALIKKLNLRIEDSDSKKTEH